VNIQIIVGAIDNRPYDDALRAIDNRPYEDAMLASEALPRRRHCGLRSAVSNFQNPKGIPRRTLFTPFFPFTLEKIRQHLGALQGYFFVGFLYFYAPIQLGAVCNLKNASACARFFIFCAVNYFFNPRIYQNACAHSARL
jgi:hypothetical protein